MNRLNEMIREERKAPKDYSKLLHQVKGTTNKNVIRGIIKQEKMHYRKLEQIKRRLR